MRRTRRQTTSVAGRALAAVALTALVVGCGSSGSKEAFRFAYERELPTLDGVRADVAAALAGVAGRSDTTLDSQFTDLAQRTARALSKLESMKVTAANATVFSALEAGVQTTQQQLAALAAAARAGDAVAARKASATISAEVVAVANAERSLNRALGIAAPA